MKFNIRNPIQASAALLDQGDILNEEINAFKSCVTSDDWRGALSSLERVHRLIHATKKTAETLIFIEGSA